MIDQITVIQKGMDLSSASTEALREHLARAMEVTADALMHMAAIWHELERRGEDMSALRSGLGVYLPLIAEGRLNANLVVKYAGRTMLLRHLASLPADEQQRLLEDDTIVVLNLLDGDLVEQEVKIGDIDSRYLRRVITDHVLSIEEQRAIIDRQGLVARNHRGSSVLAKARRRGKRAAMAATEKRYTFTAALTPEEYESVKSAAKNNGVSLSALVREGLLWAVRKP